MSNNNVTKTYFRIQLVYFDVSVSHVNDFCTIFKMKGRNTSFYTVKRTRQGSSVVCSISHTVTFAPVTWLWNLRCCLLVRERAPLHNAAIETHTNERLDRPPESVRHYSAASERCSRPDISVLFGCCGLMFGC